MGCHSLLQGIFPTQGSKPSLLRCRQILYCLHQGLPHPPPACPTLLWVFLTLEFCGSVILTLSGRLHLCLSRFLSVLSASLFLSFSPHPRLFQFSLQNK